MTEILSKYIPEPAVLMCFDLIKKNQVHLKIVNERVTRHGDYRKGLAGKHEITVNANLNKFRFLMTLVHEISHLVAFEKYGRNIKPHGLEWKHTFQALMVPFLRPDVFPNNLLHCWRGISEIRRQVQILMRLWLWHSSSLMRQTIKIMFLKFHTILFLKSITEKFLKKLRSVPNDTNVWKLQRANYIFLIQMLRFGYMSKNALKQLFFC